MKKKTLLQQNTAINGECWLS